MITKWQNEKNHSYALRLKWLNQEAARSEVPCQNTTWLTCKGPTQTHRGSLQSSKLQPFWLPWQEKDIFGGQNFNKSCQLVTDRFEKKKGKKCKKFINPWSNYQRLNANKLFCNSQIHVLTKIYGNHFTILMVAKVQLFEKLNLEPCIFI